ncbi:MAG TPA: Fic family protein [Nocardioidaceae bacterium]|nr:Fic family protein [Nocardioidaceae bacterium]
MASLPVILTGEAAADVADLERAIASFDVRAKQQHDLESLARFLLRAEAVASSKIEGLQVNTRRLARYQAGQRPGDMTAAAVMGNVDAMTLAVSTVASADRITRDHLLEIHAALMRHSDAPAIGGQVRTTQNWIGGNDFNPCFAAFVPPPPERVEILVADLCEFMNRDDLPAVVQAALVHAQFETIHPFADGNGRTGRALIHVILRRRGLATAFVPPVSLVLATRASDYVAGLTSYRYDGAPDSPAAAEGIQAWLDVFVSSMDRATDDAVALCDRMIELEQRWRAELRPRRGSTADRVLPHLIAQPVLGAGDIEGLLGVSKQAASVALDQLVKAGILRQFGQGQRRRVFEAAEVFKVLTDYERGLATPTHSRNTREERPRRHVPYRVD